MDNDKSNRLVSKLLTAARTIQGTSLGNEISNIVTEENPDAVTLANTITRISPAPNDTFLPIRTVKDLLQPHLQARIGLDQIEGDTSNESECNLSRLVGDNIFIRASSMCACMQSTKRTNGVYESLTPSFRRLGSLGPCRPRSRAAPRARRCLSRPFGFDRSTKFRAAKPNRSR